MMTQRPFSTLPARGAVLTVLVVATLCADHASVAARTPPDRPANLQRTHEGWVSRLTRSFGRQAATVSLLRVCPQGVTTAAVPLPPVQFHIPPLAFSPFNFRLPPPLPA